MDQYYQPPYYAPLLELQENGVPVRPLPEEKKWIKRAYNWAGGMLFLQVGVAFAVTLIAIIIALVSGAFSDPSKASNFSFLIFLGTAAGYTAGNLLCFFVGCRSEKIRTAPLFRWNKSTAGLILWALTVALGIQAAVILLSNMGISLINELTGVDLNRILGDQGYTDFTTEVLMTVYTCIGAPITEELVFRGFCLKQLSRFNLRFGIVASSLLFGLVHGNIIQFCLAFPLGILLAWITVKSGSIFPAILVHFVVNTSSTVLSKAAELFPQAGGIFQMVWLIFFLVAALILLLVSHLKKREALPEKTVPKSSRGWPLFFRSGAMIGLLCMYGLMIVLPLFLLPFLPMLKPILDRMYP